MITSHNPEVVVTDGPLLSDAALEAIARVLLDAPDLPIEQDNQLLLHTMEQERDS